MENANSDNHGCNDHGHGHDDTANIDQRSSTSPVERGPGKTPRGRARSLSSRLRTKPQRSCNLCRQRKLRCDRQQPCMNCTRRELGATCTYPSETGNGRTEKTHRQPTTALQDRVQHLEKLILEMVQDHQSPHSPQTPKGNKPSGGPLDGPFGGPLDGPLDGLRSRSDATTAASPSLAMLAGGSPGLSTAVQSPLEDAVDKASPSASDYGTMHHTSSGTSYVGSAHWAAVLDDIAVLKMHFEKDEHVMVDCPPVEPAQPSLSGPQLLYGCTKLTTKEELLAAIPPRAVVDQLVSGYFDSFEISPSFIHSLQFLQEYEQFWECPKSMTVIWLGQLFAIMCLATQFQRYKLDASSMAVSGTSPAEQDHQLKRSAESLRTKVVQCLILTDYIKGGPGVMEVLMLYFATELFFNQDAQVGVWLLLGTITQLAMRMGYHRDPKHFPSLTPFASEMQRRLWATIVDSDIALAMQMGLPRLIHPSQTDTGEPLNLEDCDFSTSTVEMPTSRPEMDQTPMLFRLVKSRLFDVIGSIWDLTTCNQQSTYVEVMEMSARLQQVYASIPACFQWRSKTLCMADSPRAVVHKVALQIIFHIARIILHRKYFSSPPSRNMHTQQRHSHQECLDASLKLLDFQHILQEKTEPFGQLYHERWKVYSLVNHFFLLAASILCFYLQKDPKLNYNEADEGLDTPRTSASTASMDETIRASLRKSRDIWVHSSSFSKEAKQAAMALGIVLGINTDRGPGPEQNTSMGDTAIVGSATTRAFSMPSTAGSDFMTSVATFRSSDWAEVGVPFPAIPPAWANWAATSVDMMQTPTADEGSLEAIDPITGMCFQPLPWMG